MSLRYSQHYSMKGQTTPQSEAAKDSQVRNNAGGYSFSVDDWTRLDRFLVLGAEGGTYYVDERKLTRGNAKCIERCISKDGPRTVNRIVEISDGGRAAKNDPALFALAMCAKLGDQNTRRLAHEAVPRVARIGTHLFHLAHFMEAFGGWGRGTRNAFASWYQDKDPDKLAYQLVKYQSRDGWSHRDILRLSKPRPKDAQHDSLYEWATKGTISNHDSVSNIVHAFEKAKNGDEKTVASLIREHGLPREAVPTHLLNSSRVWEALLEGMPMTAMIRNLATMTRVGLIAPMSNATKTIVSRLSDSDRLSRARIHPIQVLSALSAYQSGGGGMYTRSKYTWSPVQKIVDALDDAFHESFKFVPSTGKRTLIALDVSGSMSFTRIAGIPGLTPRQGSAAMAMVTARKEEDHHFVGFTNTSFPSLGGSQDTSGLRQLKISPKQRLDDVVKYTASLPFGGTDCSLPMLWAEKNNVGVDTFIVYTDNETWAGKIHPHEALQRYRQKTGISAKLVVVGMTATEVSIADPDDAGMLDVAGFDSAAPRLISEFSKGNI